MGDGEGCGDSPVAVSSTVIGGGGSDLERLRLLMTVMLESKWSSMFDGHDSVCITEPGGSRGTENANSTVQLQRGKVAKKRLGQRVCIDPALS